MKKVFYKILSIVMTFVVLFSTMSFTVNMHYCGGTLVETAIFKKVKGCGMEMEKPSAEGCSITKKGCCDDKQLTIEGQDQLQLSVQKISIEPQGFLKSFVFAYIKLFEDKISEVSSYEEYKPPLVIRRIYKIDETYLI